MKLSVLSASDFLASPQRCSWGLFNPISGCTNRIQTDPAVSWRKSQSLLKPFLNNCTCSQRKSDHSWIPPSVYKRNSDTSRIPSAPKCFLTKHNSWRIYEHLTNLSEILPSPSDTPDHSHLLWPLILLSNPACFWWVLKLPAWMNVGFLMALSVSEYLMVPSTQQLLRECS